MLAGAPVEIIWITDRPVWKGSGTFAKDDEVIRLGIGQRSKQHRIDHAEDSRVRTNTERKRERSDDGEGGIFGQLTKCKAEIVHVNFKSKSSPSFGTQSLDRIDHGGAPRRQ